MKRVAMIVACLGVLVVAQAGTALAGGPHHRGGGWGHGGGRPPYYAGYRGGHHGHCGPRPYVAAYPVPVYPAPAYVAPAPSYGFGVAARNFSFWFGR